MSYLIMLYAMFVIFSQIIFDKKKNKEFLFISVFLGGLFGLYAVYIHDYLHLSLFLLFVFFILLNARYDKESFIVVLITFSFLSLMIIIFFSAAKNTFAEFSVWIAAMAELFLIYYTSLKD